MASLDVNKKLAALRKNLEELLKLHNNPYDTSNANCNKVMPQVEQLRDLLASSGDVTTTTSDQTNNGSDLSNGTTNKTTETSSDTPENTTTSSSNLPRSISGSVGKGGTNNEADVRAVQGWLNHHGARLEVDGQYSNNTLKEIKKFQRRVGLKADGIISPGKKTWQGLIGDLPVGPPSSDVASIIQGGESGAAGYDAYNKGTSGNSIIAGDGSLKPSQMTLGEIMALQRRRELFAVGKYQMIPTTLQEGVASLGLPESRKFDPETQELLFSGYLMKAKRPEIHAYITGNGSAHDAQVAGAKEWASIATPPGTKRKGIDVSGKSYYDGIGGNSAHISAQDFLSALDAAKADYQKLLAQGASPKEAYHKAVTGVENTANSGGSSNTDNNDTNTNTGGNSNAGDNDTNTGAGGNTSDGGSTKSSNLSASVGKGGKNEEADVRLVQTLLNQKANASLKVDGQYGNKTLAAIKAFQRSIFNGSADGLIEPGGKTIKALQEGASSGTGDGTNTGTGDGTNTGTGTTGGSISASVGKGGKNNEADVRLVQELLNKVGGKLTVDGKYGGNTLTAIKSFQGSIFNGWSDGLIDPNGKTWKALSSGQGNVNSSTGGGGGPDIPPLQDGQKPSSSNFSYNEFISPRDPVREIPRELWGNLQKLMTSLEVIRKELGVSMKINSGYRSPGYNSKVGGASRSQHMYAKAADIATSLPPSKVYKTIIRLMDEGKIAKGGIGRYRNFTHYDVRGTKTPFKGGY